MGVTNMRVVAQSKYVSVGIYTVPDAARLTGLSQGQVRNWINGYTYTAGGETKRVDSVIHRQLPKLDDETALGFLDLIEMRVIHELLKKKFSLQAIRVIHSRAQQLFHSQHPFAAKKFRVVGEETAKKIFAKEVFSDVDDALIDVKNKQYAIDSIVGPHLEDLDFEGELARRWWPLKTNRAVVIDPARRSGQPIVTKEGIATKILYDTYLAENSVEAVADWYEVSMESVNGAIVFERQFAA